MARVKAKTAPAASLLPEAVEASAPAVRAGPAGGFAVLAERCDQCLFGPNKIVSNTRRADILRKIRREDGYFICHKASILGVEAACRGDWDQNGCGQLGRIAERLGAVRLIPEAELSTLPPDRRRGEEPGPGWEPEP